MILSLACYFSAPLFAMQLDDLSPRSLAARINKPMDAERNTRLHSAVSDGKLYYVQELLTTYKADPNVIAFLERTPLHLAAILKKKSLPQIAQTLLKYGARIDSVDYKKRTALHYACKHGKKAMVALLLEMGAKLNVVDSKGKTPRDYDATQCIKAYENSVTQTALPISAHALQQHPN